VSDAQSALKLKLEPREVLTCEKR